MKKPKWLFFWFLSFVFVFGNLASEKEGVDGRYEVDLSSRGRSSTGIIEILKQALTDANLAPGRDIELILNPPTGAGLEYGNDIIDTLQKLIPSFIDTTDTSYKFLLKKDSKDTLIGLQMEIICGFRKGSIVNDLFDSSKIVMEPFIVQIPSLEADLDSKFSGILEKALSAVRKKIDAGESITFVIDVEAPEGVTLPFGTQILKTLQKQLLTLTSSKIRYNINERINMDTSTIVNKIEYLVNMFADDHMTFRIDLTKPNIDFSEYMLRLISRVIATSKESCPHLIVEVKLAEGMSDDVIEPMIRNMQKLFSKHKYAQKCSISDKTETDPIHNTFNLHINCVLSNDRKEIATSRSFGLGLLGVSDKLFHNFIGDYDLVLDLTKPDETIESNLRNLMPTLFSRIQAKLKKQNHSRLTFSMKITGKKDPAYEVIAKIELSRALNSYFTDCHISVDSKPILSSAGFLKNLIFHVSLERINDSTNHIPGERLDLHIDLRRPSADFESEVRKEIAILLPGIFADLQHQNQVMFSVYVKPPYDSHSEFDKIIQMDLMKQLENFFENYRISVIPRMTQMSPDFRGELVFDVTLQKSSQGQFSDDIQAPSKEILIFLDKPGASLVTEISKTLPSILPNLEHILSTKKPTSFVLKVKFPQHATGEYLNEFTPQIWPLLKTFFPNERLEITSEIMRDNQGYISGITSKIDIYPDVAYDSSWEKAKPSNSWTTVAPDSDYWDAFYPMDQWSMELPAAHQLDTWNGVDPWYTSKPSEMHDSQIAKPPGMNDWEMTDSPGNWNAPSSQQHPFGENNPWGTKPPGSYPWDGNRITTAEPREINPWATTPTRVPQLDGSDPNDMKHFQLPKPPGIKSESSGQNPWDTNRITTTKPHEINPWATTPTRVPQLNGSDPNDMNNSELNKPQGMQSEPPGQNPWETNPQGSNPRDKPTYNDDIPPNTNSSHEDTNTTTPVQIDDIMLDTEGNIEETVISKLRQRLIPIKILLKSGKIVDAPITVQLRNRANPQNIKDVGVIVRGIFEKYFPNYMISIHCGHEEGSQFAMNVIIKAVNKKIIAIDLSKHGRSIYEVIQTKLSQYEGSLTSLNRDKKWRLILNIMKSENDSPEMIIDIVKILKRILKQKFEDKECTFDIGTDGSKKLKIVVNLKVSKYPREKEYGPTNFMFHVPESKQSPTTRIERTIDRLYSTLKPLLDEERNIDLNLDMDLPTGSNDLSVKTIIDHLKKIINEKFPMTVVGVSPYVFKDSNNFLPKIHLVVTLQEYSIDKSIQVNRVPLDLSNLNVPVHSKIQEILPNLISGFRSGLMKLKPVTLILEIRPPGNITETYLSTFLDALVPLLATPFCNNKKKTTLVANTDIDGYVVDMSLIITFEPSGNSRQGYTEEMECKKIINIDLTKPGSSLKGEVDKFLPFVHPDIQMFLEQGKIENLQFHINPPRVVGNEFLKETQEAFMEILRNYFPYNDVNIKVSADKTSEGSYKNVRIIITIKPDLNPLPPASINLHIDLSKGGDVKFYVENALHLYQQQILSLLSSNPPVTISFKIVPPEAADKGEFEIISSDLLEAINEIFGNRKTEMLSKGAQNSKGEFFSMMMVITMS